MFAKSQNATRFEQVLGTEYESGHRYLIELLKKMETKRIRTGGNEGRCTKQRSKKKYTKKRKYHGKKKQQQPQESVPVVVEDVPVVEDENILIVDDEQDLPVPHPKQTQTLSETKIDDIDESGTPEDLSGYRLMDISVLGDVFTSLACPECCTINSLHLHDINEKKKGLARFLILKCVTCPYEKQFYSSKKVDRPDANKGGGNFMEVNVRAVYGMRAVGGGHTPLKKFCCYMDMPEPMNSLSYDNTSNEIKEAAKVVAERSMSDAAKDLRGDNESADVAVSVDGTWQKKGFTSTLGVVTAISVDSGKVLDVSIMSKSCKACTSMSSVKKTDPERYERWHASHKDQCNLNYQGSSHGESWHPKNIRTLREETFIILLHIILR